MENGDRANALKDIQTSEYLHEVMLLLRLASELRLPIQVFLGWNFLNSSSG